ncbi:MAG: hypothetical protein P0S94_04000 [Simkaniaceae bacterium]|nr:hypothetical protein [Simkaniaceae bacterium]
MTGPFIPIEGTTGSYTPPPWEEPPAYRDVMEGNQDDVLPDYFAGGNNVLDVPLFNFNSLHNLGQGTQLDGRETTLDARGGAFSIIGRAPDDFWNGDAQLRVETSDDKKIYRVVNHRVEQERKTCKYVTTTMLVVIVVSGLFAAMENASKVDHHRSHF